MPSAKSAPVPAACESTRLLCKVLIWSRGMRVRARDVYKRQVQALAALLEHEVYPCIPSKGSVGASGDLAPLAHMSAVLLGVGHVRVGGRILPAARGLERAGLKPLTLGPKEGLALLNGTQVSTALALSGLVQICLLYTSRCV